MNGLSTSSQIDDFEASQSQSIIVVEKKVVEQTEEEESDESPHGPPTPPPPARVQPSLTSPPETPPPPPPPTPTPPPPQQTNGASGNDAQDNAAEKNGVEEQPDGECLERANAVTSSHVAEEIHICERKINSAMRALEELRKVRCKTHFFRFTVVNNFLTSFFGGA